VNKYLENYDVKMHLGINGHEGLDDHSELGRSWRA